MLLLLLMLTPLKMVVMVVAAVAASAVMVVVTKAFAFRSLGTLIILILERKTGPRKTLLLGARCFVVRFMSRKAKGSRF